jgi:hypothetical protein
MVTTSPFCVCLTKLEKLVFASKIVAVIIVSSNLSFYLNQYSGKIQQRLLHVVIANSEEESA